MSTGGARPIIQCVHCGGPTRSKVGVCQDCHAPAYPTKVRCRKCGGATQRKEGICRPCTRSQERCATCGVVPTTKGECASCEAAKKDDESPRDLGNGYWRQRRGGAKEWVPLLPIKAGETPPELLLPKRTCPGCDTVFRPSHGLQRYCGRQCRNRVDYLRRLARSPATVEAKPASRREPLPATRTLRQFTDDECRDGRARYEQGDRSPDTVARNREYRRVVQAARRQRLQDTNKEEVA